MNPRTKRRLIPLVTAAALVLAVAPGGTAGVVAQAAPAAPRTVRLAGSSSSLARSARLVGSPAAGRQSTVQLWLRPDVAGATAYAAAVSTPGRPGFHHYLTPSAWTARFGATAGAATSVASWMRGRGFSAVSVDPQRNFVRGTGNLATVESSFAVRMHTYRSGGRTVTANDRDVSLPPDIARSVLGVTGLTDVRAQTLNTRGSGPRAVSALRSAAAAAPTGTATRRDCATWYGQKVRTHLPKYHGSTSFPVALCGYSGSALRTAYGMNTANRGTGQTVAYIEVGTPYKMASTLTRWAKSSGLPAPTAGSYRELAVGHGSECGNVFDVEEQLDVEAGYAMAPGAHHLLVGGDSCDYRLQGLQALFDAELVVVDGNGTAPLASIVSNSWGLTGEGLPSIYPTILHAIMVRAAGLGVGMYFSSGDNPGIAIPADDPFVTAVGGTSLGLDADRTRLFETGWSNESLLTDGKRYYDAGIGRSAAGGGTSLLWSEPDYQRGVVPASMTTPPAGDGSGQRAVPDISALADAFTGISQSITEPGKKDSYYTFADGGTSLASPLVAGMVAAAQQGQPAPFGFANPVLYGLATTAYHDPQPVTSSTPAAYQAVFCPETNELCGIDSLETLDAETKAYTDQVTAIGFDTMTGLGTPRGQQFVTALRAATRA